MIFGLRFLQYFKRELIITEQGTTFIPHMEYNPNMQNIIGPSTSHDILKQNISTLLTPSLSFKTEQTLSCHI